MNGAGPVTCVTVPAFPVLLSRTRSPSAHTVTGWATHEGARGHRAPGADAPEECLADRPAAAPDRPQFPLHCTPTGSSWLDLVERWFAELTNEQVRRGVHKTVLTLEKGIRTGIAARNTGPRPYVRPRTADEIPERLASYPSRTPGSEDQGRFTA